CQEKLFQSSRRVEDYPGLRANFVTRKRPKRLTAGKAGMYEECCELKSTCPAPASGTKERRAALLPDSAAPDWPDSLRRIQAGGTTAFAAGACCAPGGQPDDRPSGRARVVRAGAD